MLGDVTRARQGFLPSAGGVDDQDARFVEAWETLDQAMGVCQAREHKRAQEAQQKQLKDLEKRIEAGRKRKKKGR